MAGEWIPVRVDLFGCPQVVQILSRVCPDCVRNKSERVRKTSEVVGALIRMWSLFDRHTDDGELHGYTTFILDDEVGIDGFSDAVASVGWLLIESNSLKMPEFSKYLSTSAKTRMKDAQRKREQRAVSEKCPENVQIESDKKRTTEEKRIKEKKTEDKEEENTKEKKAPPPAVALFDATKIELPEKLRTEHHKEAWIAFVKHRSAMKKPIKETSIQGIFSMLERMPPDVAYASLVRTTTSGWQGIRECPRNELHLFRPPPKPGEFVF
jgi:hypothetical protein